MPVTKLTIQTVKNAVAINGVETVYRDTEISGFTLKVTPSDRKIFFFQYRTGGGRKGRSRKITIGKFPAIKPDDARKIALQYAADVARKIDPQEKIQFDTDTKLEAMENSFASVLEIYANEQLSQNRTGKDEKALFEREFLSEWRNRPVKSLRRKDIRKIVNRILTEGKGYAANRALSKVQTFFRWMASEDYIEADPAAAMKKPFKGEKHRDRVLEPNEIKAIWLEFDHLNCKPFADALRLLMLMGQRRTEVGSMRWDDLDLKNGIWEMPGEVTKNKQRHKLPLIGKALEIIKKQKRVVFKDKSTGQTTPCPYVFTTTGHTPISGWSKTKKQLEDGLVKGKSKIKNWRYHDFRRTISTALGDAGYEDNEIKLLLNHSRGGVTAIYNRSDYIEKKRKMMRIWDKKLATIISK